MKKLIIVIVVFFSLVVKGQTPTPNPNSYVNDFAGKLSLAEIHGLNKEINAIEKKSSVQFAIILVDKISLPIEEYTRMIGEKWHVGNAKNGLVYVAVIGSHQQRLEVASHLQGDIPDIVASELLDITKQYFKKGSFYGGLSALVVAVANRIDPVAKEQRALLEENRKKEAQKFNHTFLIILIGLLACTGGVIIYFCFVFPIGRRKLKKETAINLKQKTRFVVKRPWQLSPPPTVTQKKANNEKSSIIVPFIVDTLGSNDVNAPISSSSYTSSDDSDSSSYGSWGSDSSSSSDSSSGFDGGGSSSDW